MFAGLYFALSLVSLYMTVEQYIRKTYSINKSNAIFLHPFLTPSNANINTVPRMNNDNPPSYIYSGMRSYNNDSYSL